MRSKMLYIGLIAVIIILLGDFAVCAEAANDPQTGNPQTENPQTKQPQKCPGSKPDECDGKCVNLQNDEENCGDCGNVCNPGEVCNNGKCINSNNNKKATCTDGKKNGKETDIDCGGPTCPACANEKTCKTNMDCSSGVCAAGFCQAPSCVDQVKNGGETGVDCGGPCKPCQKPISGIGNITVLPIQNAPGMPAPNLTLGPPPTTTPTYLFVIDHCSVSGTRSPNTDTDYLGFGVSVNNQVLAVKNQFLGDLTSASSPYQIDLEIGPIAIPNDRTVPVTIAYVIVNIGNPSGVSGNIDDATKALLNSYSGSGSPLAFVDKNLGYIYNSYCDGAVAAIQYPVDGQRLVNAGEDQSWVKQDYFAGTDSPTGCGSNSRYFVNWHIKKVS